MSSTLGEKVKALQDMVYEYQAMIDKLKNSVTGDSCIACNISSMEIELLRGKCDIMQRRDLSVPQSQQSVQVPMASVDHPTSLPPPQSPNTSVSFRPRPKNATSVRAPLAIQPKVEIEDSKVGILSRVSRNSATTYRSRNMGLPPPNAEILVISDDDAQEDDMYASDPPHDPQPFFKSRRPTTINQSKRRCVDSDTEDIDVEMNNVESVVSTNPAHHPNSAQKPGKITYENAASNPALMALEPVNDYAPGPSANLQRSNPQLQRLRA